MGSSLGSAVQRIYLAGKYDSNKLTKIVGTTEHIYITNIHSTYTSKPILVISGIKADMENVRYSDSKKCPLNVPQICLNNQ